MPPPQVANRPTDRAAKRKDLSCSEVNEGEHRAPQDSREAVECSEIKPLLSLLRDK